MTVQQVIGEFSKRRNSKNTEGMARFGINTSKAFGVSMPFLRNFAKEIGRNHPLAKELWKTEYHEVRILAALIAEPEKTTSSLMNKWVKDFNSWDLCDQTCNGLFIKTPFFLEKIYEWNDSRDEFVKRASFVLMACSAVHRKEMTNEDFLKFFPLIEKHSSDERNFVKKAVNWALRQIGKRNRFLNKAAIEFSEKLSQNGGKTAKWIANDALKELTNRKIQVRLKP